MSTTVRTHCLSGLVPASDIGRVMFSSASSVGSRLNAWKTKPMRSRRTRVSSRSESAPRSTSPMKTWPDVSESRPARQCISVLLPEPDGPMMAVKRPAGMPTRHVVEGDDLGVAVAVDLDGAARRGRRGGWARPSRAALRGQRSCACLQDADRAAARADGACRCLRPGVTPTVGPIRVFQAIRVSDAHLSVARHSDGSGSERGRGDRRRPRRGADRTSPAGSRCAGRCARRTGAASAPP